jgi:FAD/FMN-containing dehydrogenase
MNTAMSIDNSGAMPAPPPAATRLIGLRVVLILAALFEAFDGYATFSATIGDPSHRGALGLAGVLTTAQIASHPFLAAAALGFALIGRVRDAIIAMGAILAMNWLSEMPSVVLHGFELNDPTNGPLVLSHIVAYPLMAACAIALARRGEWLGIATTLIALPTLFTWVGVTAFAIAVSIHGF